MCIRRLLGDLSHKVVQNAWKGNLRCLQLGQSGCGVWGNGGNALGKVRLPNIFLLSVSRAVSKPHQQFPCRPGGSRSGIATYGVSTDGASLDPQMRDAALPPSMEPLHALAGVRTTRMDPFSIA